jgi:hypothetical protein
MTSSEIDPATFRFVAQYLNHCATAWFKDSEKAYLITIIALLFNKSSNQEGFDEGIIKYAGEIRNFEDSLKLRDHFDYPGRETRPLKSYS